VVEKRRILIVNGRDSIERKRPVERERRGKARRKIRGGGIVTTLLRHIDPQAERPRKRESKRECTLVVRPAFIVLRRGHRRNQCRQRRRAPCGSQELRGA